MNLPGMRNLLIIPVYDYDKLVVFDLRIIRKPQRSRLAIYVQMGCIVADRHQDKYENQADYLQATGCFASYRYQCA